MQSLWWLTQLDRYDGENLYQAPSLEPWETHSCSLRKESASGRSLTLKGGNQRGHSWVRARLKIDGVLGICIQWRESCVQCSAYLCMTFTAARVVFIVSAMGEQAPGFFYCQRQCILPSGPPADELKNNECSCFQSLSQHCLDQSHLCQSRFKYQCQMSKAFIQVLSALFCSTHL